MTGSCVPCPIATRKPARSERSSSKPLDGRHEAATGRRCPRVLGGPARDRARRPSRSPARSRRGRCVRRARPVRSGSSRASPRRARRSAERWRGRESRSRERRTSARRPAAATAGRGARRRVSRPVGVERVEEREQVVLVGAAAVEQDERTLRLACRRNGPGRRGSPSRPARPRVGQRRQDRLDLLAQVLERGRQDQRLAEVLRILVDREARVRAWRSRRGRRSARGSRSSGTRSGR